MSCGFRLRKRLVRDIGARLPICVSTSNSGAIRPCSQLIYCRDIADFVQFVAPLGRFLALRGEFLLMLDANGPVTGLVGRFFRDKMPKYFKGQQQPRLGDLAYTEIAVLGV